MGEQKKQQVWKTWRLDIAKQMPPLHHAMPGDGFDITKSEVVKWLMSQPEIMQLIFNAVRGQKRIVYDKATGTWRGVDYAD